MAQNRLIYRPEIDGLRALAVVPVVLFHAGVPGFSGGYIGVDVFFVISGYLITSILLSDLEAERFSLLQFYERRARRILPALFAVIALCLPFAWMWMFPSEIVAFGKSILATALFVSNVLFWRESGYFDPSTELKPLLHTWSLAVEEQYYLFFPVFLFLMHRYARRAMLTALLFLILGSLTLAEWGWRNTPAAAFYLAPTRIWEILIGAACATLTQSRTCRSQWLALVGLVMIIIPIPSFGPDVPTPSLLTAIPVLGAAFVIIFATDGTLAAALLKLRPFVTIGLISYSTYLWHQPLLAFTRIRLIAEPGPVLVGALVLASFVFGWLSWRFIEAPFRNGAIMGRRAIFFAGAAGTGTLSAVAIVLVVLDGVPSRQAPNGQSFAEFTQIEQTLAPNYGLDASCDKGDFGPQAICSTDEQPSALLWGDSFAMHLVQALQSSPTKLPFVQATYSGCGPIIDLAPQQATTTWRSCMNFNDAVLAWVQQQPEIQTVIVSSPFRQTERPLYRRDGSVIREPAARLTAISASLMGLRDLLSQNNKRLVIVSPPPQNGIDLGICEVRRQAMGAVTEACDLNEADYRNFSAPTITLLNAVADHIPVIWLSDLTCASGTCRTLVGGSHLYRDAGHLSIIGSAALGRETDLAGIILSAVQ